MSAQAMGQDETRNISAPRIRRRPIEILVCSFGKILCLFGRHAYWGIGIDEYVCTRGGHREPDPNVEMFPNVSLANRWVLLRLAVEEGRLS